MLFSQHIVPSCFGQLRPGKFLLICLMTLGSMVSVSAQTNRDSVDFPASDSLRGRDAFGVGDSAKSRIDLNGQGRWTNIAADTGAVSKVRDSLRDVQENAQDVQEGISTAKSDSTAKDSPKVSDPVVVQPGKGDRGGKQPAKDSLEGTDPVVVRPGKGDRGNPPQVDPPSGDTLSRKPGKNGTPDEAVESVVRKDPEQKAVDSTLSRRKLRLSALAPPDPNVALRRSLLLPGWGQIYNRSAWKVPIIYAGFGGLGYMFVFNHREYRYYKLAAICVGTDNCTAYPEFDGFSQANIISDREFHRRYRDLSVVIGALWYALNGIDAYVEAHLQPFDVGDDLSLRVKPSVLPDPFQQRNVYLGASISLGFGK